MGNKEPEICGDWDDEKIRKKEEYEVKQIARLERTGGREEMEEGEKQQERREAQNEQNPREKIKGKERARERR